ncbi:MAG TPA: response regulator [Pseudomonadales bacterium]|nr:response regulator [Pseudomonadales bacterium]
MNNVSWPQSIAIISDDETDNELLNCLLSEQFNLIFLHTLDEVEQHFKQEPSDLFILNATGSQEETLTLLKKIKAASTDKKAPYILLLANNTLDLKIQAYEIGVNEFLNKPFDIYDFNIRLSNILEIRDNLRLVQAQSEKASQTALLAMETSSELGIIMRYTDTINSLHDLNELGQALLNTCRAIGIKCSYQFRALDETITQGNPLGSFDEQLINEFKTRGNILDFGSRSVFNKPLVSILAKNMPNNAPLKYGRLKDHFQLIISATDNKLGIINTHRKLQKQQNASTLTIIQNSHSALSNVSLEFAKLSEHIDSTMSWLKMELEHKLISLNLSEEQEQALMDMVDDTMERLALAYNSGVEIDNQVSRIKTFLSQLI